MIDTSPNGQRHTPGLMQLAHAQAQKQRRADHHSPNQRLSTWVGKTFRIVIGAAAALTLTLSASLAVAEVRSTDNVGRLVSFLSKYCIDPQITPKEASAYLVGFVPATGTAFNALSTSFIDSKVQVARAFGETQGLSPQDYAQLLRKTFAMSPTETDRENADLRIHLNAGSGQLGLVEHRILKDQRQLVECTLIVKSPKASLIAELEKRFEIFPTRENEKVRLWRSTSKRKGSTAWLHHTRSLVLTKNEDGTSAEAAMEFSTFREVIQ